jgi:hypothetical protein
MIGKIVNRDYSIQQSVPQLMQLYQRPDFANVNNKDNVGEVKGVKDTKVEDIDDQRSEARKNITSYFRRATGAVTGVAGKPKKEAGEEAGGAKGEPTPFTFDVDDRIKLSLEARDEILEDKENAFEVFRNAQPLNMSAFMDGLGIDKPAVPSNGGSLASKLDAISRKSTGRGFE